MKKLLITIIALFTLSKANVDCTGTNPWVEGLGYQNGVSVVVNNNKYVNIADGANVEFCGLAPYAPNAQYGYLCWDFIDQCMSNVTVEDSKVYEIKTSTGSKKCTGVIEANKGEFPMSIEDMLTVPSVSKIMMEADGVFVLISNIEVRALQGFSGQSYLQFTPLKTTLTNTSNGDFTSSAEGVMVGGKNFFESVTNVTAVGVGINDALNVKVTSPYIILGNPADAADFVKFEVCYEGIGTLQSGAVKYTVNP